MYYNPAGLALGEGTFVLVEGTFAWRSVTYDRDPGAIDNPGTGTPDPAVNSGESSLSNIIISPFIGVKTDFGVKGLGVAAGFYTPFGGQAVWDENSAFEGNTQYPGAVDGPQRWHNIEGVIRSSYITLAGAYKLPANISIGVGANVVLSVIDTIRASNVDGSDDVVTSHELPLPYAANAFARATLLTTSLWSPHRRYCAPRSRMAARAQRRVLSRSTPVSFIHSSRGTRRLVWICARQRARPRSPSVSPLWTESAKRLSLYMMVITAKARLLAPRPTPRAS